MYHQESDREGDVVQVTIQAALSSSWGRKPSVGELERMTETTGCLGFETLKDGSDQHLVYSNWGNDRAAWLTVEKVSMYSVVYSESESGRRRRRGRPPWQYEGLACPNTTKHVATTCSSGVKSYCLLYQKYVDVTVTYPNKVVTLS